jgi:adenylate kinase
MAVLLAVSGVAGSGKSVVSEGLGRILGYPVFDLTGIIKSGGLFDGRDNARDSLIVDVERLRGHLTGKIRGNAVLDGLLSHHLNPTHTVVLRCNPRILYDRLLERGYPRGKIMENVEAEYLGVISDEALGLCDNVLEVDSSKEVDMGRVKCWIAGGGVRMLEYDWADDFMRLL